MESVVVIDIGSQTLKAGLAAGFPNDQEPRLVRRSYIALVDAGVLGGGMLGRATPITLYRPWGTLI